MPRHLPILVLASLLLPPAIAAEEPVDWTMVNRIRDEGFHRSQVMETLEHLADTIGPRLTGSPGMTEANEWTRDQLTEWGLENAHLESYEFGRGWSFSRASVHLQKPREMPLVALPKAWTPGTDGPVKGPAVKVSIESEKDFDKYRGQLAGKILLLDEAREIESGDEAAIRRYSDDELEKIEDFEVPGGRGRDWRARFKKRYRFGKAFRDFLVEEKVLATVEISSRDAGLVRVTGGGTREADGNPGVPALVMAAEQYNWLTRIADEVKAVEKGDGEKGGEEKGGEAKAEPVEEAAPDPHGTGDPHGTPASHGTAGSPAAGSPAAEEPGDGEPAAGTVDSSEPEDPAVELEIDIRARFHDDDLLAYNTVAEIPGTDKNAGIVIAGAHLDSWHSGTGTTDNGAGCAVAMEAVRILKALDVRPRRTIRVGLWSGEEQGLQGSRAYVEEHFATIPVGDDPEEADLPRRMRTPAGGVETKGDHARFSAYFNLDNGSGKIRGIWGQENAAAVPIFEAWLEPFEDLGADTVTARNTRGTDHQAFDRVGLPGFQFIQDGLDYWSRTHHTHMDVLDHAVREDLISSSVILASFLYHAAMRDEPLPRKPMPKYEPPKEKKGKG